MAIIIFLYPDTEREKLNAQTVFALPALFIKRTDSYGGLRETKIQNVVMYKTIFAIDIIIYSCLQHFDVL